MNFWSDSYIKNEYFSPESVGLMKHNQKNQVTKTHVSRTMQRKYY